MSSSPMTSPRTSSPRPTWGWSPPPAATTPARPRLVLRLRKEIRLGPYAGWPVPLQRHPCRGAPPPPPDPDAAREAARLARPGADGPRARGRRGLQGEHAPAHAVLGRDADVRL